jgi:hypothetical protein
MKEDATLRGINCKLKIVPKLTLRKAITAIYKNST